MDFLTGITGYVLAALPGIVAFVWTWFQQFAKEDTAQDWKDDVVFHIDAILDRLDSEDDSTS